LYPEVADGSTLAGKFSQQMALPVGVEGQADAAGTGSVGVLYTISRPSEADGYFGPVSNLATLVKTLLDGGVYPVYAIISNKGSTPTLVQRQAAWAELENKDYIRIRMTDSVLNSDHVAMGVSCDNANLMSNKQFGIVGMASGTLKAALITAAQAIQHKRMVLVAPGAYDEYGVLQSGRYVAAKVAALVSSNFDPSDDLDLALVPPMTFIEKDSNGFPIFREKVVSSSLVNDFEDLLQGGVSPVQNGRNGGVSTTHLRTTWTTDTTFDALMTRVIIDQVFVDVREYCYDNNFLRRGNTPLSRAMLQAGVSKILTDRSEWVQPVMQPDGNLGYKVSVVPSSDQRQVIVGYEGMVVRGIQTILVAGNLTIAA
jgi:hypothetical protein